MTEQYAQQQINVMGWIPVFVTTPDANPLDVVLGSLTVDGSSMVLHPHGGGSLPSDVNGQNYNIVGFAFAGRAGGVVTIRDSLNVGGFAGVPPAITVVAVGDNVVLRITTGNPLPYNHRLKFLRTVF